LAQGRFYDTVNFEDTEAEYTEAADSETFVLIRFWKKE
jgi:hypothetical protein